MEKQKEGIGGPTVSIVIVNWNVADFLDGCLQSIEKNTTNIPLQVIVVDNASEDDSVARLKRKYPWVQVVANQVNVGFARANNQALQYVRGQFVCLLNPDTVVAEGALEKLVGCLRSHPDVGMVGPRILFSDGRVQGTSARLLFTLGRSLLCDSLKLDTLPLLGPWMCRRYISPYDYSVTQEVEAISGTAMVIRKSIIDEVGLFGESFLHCGEDLDLCWRVRRCRWKIMYVTDAVVFHYESRSAIQAPVRVEVNAVLSTQQYFLRCFGTLQATCYRIIVQTIAVPGTLVAGIAKIITGNESLEGLKRRFAVAKGLSRWRPVE